MSSGSSGRRVALPAPVRRSMSCLISFMVKRMVKNYIMNANKILVAAWEPETFCVLQRNTHVRGDLKLGCVCELSDFHLQASTPSPAKLSTSKAFLFPPSSLPNLKKHPERSSRPLRQCLSIPNDCVCTKLLSRSSKKDGPLLFAKATIIVMNVCKSIILPGTGRVPCEDYLHHIVAASGFLPRTFV